ncbi:hypothetical protein ACHAQK_000530 [Fusarium lateritium]
MAKEFRDALKKSLKEANANVEVETEVIEPAPVNEPAEVEEMTTPKKTTPSLRLFKHPKFSSSLESLY